MKKIFISIVLFSAVCFGALLTMTRIGTGDGLTTGTAYQYKITMTNATSEWLLIPKDIQHVVVSIDVVSNFGRIEYTTVRVEDVLATGYYFSWPSGNVTNDTADTLWAPVTALRLIASTNICVMYVRAQ